MFSLKSRRNPEASQSISRVCPQDGFLEIRGGSQTSLHILQPGMSEKGLLSPRAFLSVWATEQVRDGSVSEDLMGPRASDVTKNDGSMANWGL